LILKRDEEKDLKRVLLPLSVFFTYLGVVGMGASAKRDSLLSEVADLTLLSIHLGFITFMAVLVLWERWGRKKSYPTTIIRNARRWWTDDHTPQL
jgi:hypothetical protein